MSLAVFSLGLFIIELLLSLLSGEPVRAISLNIVSPAAGGLFICRGGFLPGLGYTGFVRSARLVTDVERENRFDSSLEGARTAVEIVSYTIFGFRGRGYATTSVIARGPRTKSDSKEEPSESSHVNVTSAV